MNNVTIETIGRRHYLRNTPFAAKDAVKSAGCNWDAGERAWWTGKRDVAEALLAKIGGASAAPSTERKAPGERATVAGRAEYKGKTYYMAGRVENGRTCYDDSVSPVWTKDGSKVLLYARDGKFEFWADRSLVRVVKSYDRPQTIGGLASFAAKARRNDGPEKRCWECGCGFTELDARRNGGDWSDSYCGC